MLQIATFQLPDDTAKANEFLKTHKPAGEIARMGDCLFIAFDDGTESPVYEIAELQELLKSNKNARLQQEIAKHVLEYQRADVNYNQNKTKFDDLSAAIQACTLAIDIQDAKAAFVEGRIEALRKTING